MALGSSSNAHHMDADPSVHWLPQRGMAVAGRVDNVVWGHNDRWPLCVYLCIACLFWLHALLILFSDIAQPGLLGPITQVTEGPREARAQLGISSSFSLLKAQRQHLSFSLLFFSLFEIGCHRAAAC